MLATNVSSEDESEKVLKVFTSNGIFRVSAGWNEPNTLCFGVDSIIAVFQRARWGNSTIRALPASVSSTQQERNLEIFNKFLSVPGWAKAGSGKQQ
jgi:hypothetical protein